MPIPIRGLMGVAHPNNVTFNTNRTCVLTLENFGDFKLFGSLAAFFIPLLIMMIIYLLTIRVLRKKVYLLHTRAWQRPGRPSVCTVFQSPAGPPADPPAGEDTPALGRHSMQNLSNEQRASKVLGVVFLLFVVMWCPFFITNVTSVLCGTCDTRLVGRLLDVFVWVGYVSSGVNPLVYTLFNRTFRQAFARYITCRFGNMTTPTPGRRNLISFRSSMAENSKLFIKHGVRNGIGPVGYQSPRRGRPGDGQLTSGGSGVLLETLLLTENEDYRPDQSITCL